MDDLHSQVNLLKSRLEALIQVYFGPNFCDEVKEYTVRHPFVAAAFGVIAVLSALPIGVFLCFATITVFISVICFIFVGGSILLCGGVVLIGIVSLITFITVSLTSSVAIAYWFAQRLHGSLCGTNRRSYPMNNLSVETRNQNNSSPSQGNRNQNCNVVPDSPSNGGTPADGTENYEVIG